LDAVACVKMPLGAERGHAGSQLVAPHCGRSVTVTVSSGIAELAVI